jgi:hypothetical protein
MLFWILAAMSAALLVMAARLWMQGRRRPPKLPLPTEWTLHPRPVFSNDERRVYRQLREALPHHVVLSKLPLVRFCQASDPHEVRYWYELLGSIHVTFAICSPNGRVLVAIDMDEDRAASPRSLQIKQSVLNACRVRHLRCSADKLPSIPELQLLVPQGSGPARGAQPAPMVGAREGPAAPIALRRRDRATLWHDSNFMQDSFFGLEGKGEGPVSGANSSFGAGLSVREISLGAEAQAAKPPAAASGLRH